MTIRKCMFLIAMVIVFSLVSKSSFAQGSEKKSVGIAVLLSFDMLPGTSLFYSGHNTEAIINTVMGAAGLGLVLGPALAEEDCAPSDSQCVVDNTLDSIPLVFLGVLFYGGAVIWDGVSGPIHVSRDNQKIDEKNANVFRRIQPIISLSSRQKYFGARFTF